MNQVDAFGSILLAANMNYQIEKITLQGSNNNTIQSNEVQLIQLDIQGSGSWVLLDNLFFFDNISVFRGFLDASDVELTGGKFKVLNDASVNIQNSTLNLSGTSGFGAGTFHIDNPLVSLMAQGSRILLSSSNTPSVYGNGSHQLDYVRFTDPDAQATVISLRMGATKGPSQPFMNYNTLIFNGNGEMIGNNAIDELIFGIGKTYILESESVQRILTHWEVRGFQCLPLVLKASNPNVQAFVEKANGNVDGEFIIMSDMNADGGAIFNAGKYSQDINNNSGWTFDERPDFSVEGILGADFYLCPGEPVVLNADDRLVEATIIWNGSLSQEIYIADKPEQITVQAVFGAGCELQDTVQVFAGPDLTFDLGADISTCNNGSGISLDASVAESTANYLWSNGSTDPVLITNTSGLYFVDVSDKGCMVSDSITLNLTSAPAIDVLQDTFICSGSNYVANLDSMLGSFTWSTSNTGSSETFQVAGDYYVDISDPAGCVSRDSFALSVMSIGLDLGGDTSLCENDVLALDAAITDPTASYRWSDGITSPVRMINASGTYYIEITTDMCASSDTIEVLIDSLPDLGLSANYSICSGELLSLDLSDIGLDFLWSTTETSPEISLNAAGMYSVTASRGNCSKSSDFQLDVVTTPVINLGGDTILCDDTPILLSAGSGPYDYVWSDGSTGNTLLADSSGVYSVSVDNAGCLSEDTIQVSLGGIPELGLQSEYRICNGEELTIDLSGTSGTISWSNGTSGPVGEFITDGKYFVNIGLPGCAYQDSFLVEVIAPPLLNLGPDTSICQGSGLSLDASGSGATAFEWSTGDTTASITYAVENDEIIKLTVFNDQCSQLDSILISAKTAPVFDLGANVEICKGEEVQLTVDNSIPVIWSDGSLNSSINVGTPGTYWATSGNDECTFTDSINVLISEASAFDLGADTTICSNDRFLLDATVTNGSYDWSDGSTTGTLLVSNSGIYSVEVFDGFCTTRDTINITVQNCVALNLFIPNIFSPNGDGLNDDFGIYLEDNVQIQEYRMMIFDRWGNLIFQSTSLNDKWNGTISGSAALKPDVYVYSLYIDYIKNSNRLSLKRSGDVLLMR